MTSCIDLVFTNCLACWRMMLDEHPEQKTNHFASLLTNSWVALACFHIISFDLATEVYPLAAVMLQWREGDSIRSCLIWPQYAILDCKTWQNNSAPSTIRVTQQRVGPG